MQPYLQNITLCQCNLNFYTMTKTLRVIEPFFVMELGDTFEYSAEADMYVSEHKQEFYKMDGENDNDIKSSYNSKFQISPEYAQSLVEDGFLEEVPETGKTTFVNIFGEIDTLLAKYKKNLENLNEDCIGLPACVKIEKETVLTNLITLLEHLKSLKK